MPARALTTGRKIFVDAIENAPGLAVNRAADWQPHRRIRDIGYGREPRRLDAYLPLRGPPSATIVYLYGGSWSSGSKEIYRFLGAALAARGILAIIPDYSLYPSARYPAFLEDAAHALLWARDNADRFDAPRAGLFVMGHSAGAHLAAMLAFEKRWLAAVGLNSRRDLAGVIGLAGPYDFDLDSDLLRGVFGHEGNKAITQPLFHVSRDSPPLLLATGEADSIVQPRNTRQLADAVRKAGGDVETIYYPRLGHRGIVGAFSPLFRFLAPVAKDVLAYVSTQSARADNTAASGGDRRGLDERV